MLFVKSNETIFVKLVSEPMIEEEKTLFGIKPISILDIKGAKVACGKVPFDALKRRQEKAVEYIETLKQAVIKIKPSINYINYELASKELSSEELLEVHSFLSEYYKEKEQTEKDFELGSQLDDWEVRYYLELCKLGVVEVSGDKVDKKTVEEILSLVRPASLYYPVVKELSEKVLEVSELTPEKKVKYVQRFGLPMTRLIDKDGSANIVE